MLNKLNVFYSEVVRIAGSIAEGNLMVQAQVDAVEGPPFRSLLTRWPAHSRETGVWALMVSETNRMAFTLSSQLSQFQAIVRLPLHTLRFPAHMVARRTRRLPATSRR